MGVRVSTCSHETGSGECRATINWDVATFPSALLCGRVQFWKEVYCCIFVVFPYITSIGLRLEGEWAQQSVAFGDCCASTITCFNSLVLLALQVLLSCSTIYQLLFLLATRPTSQTSFTSFLFFQLPGILVKLALLTNSFTRLLALLATSSNSTTSFLF